MSLTPARGILSRSGTILRLHSSELRSPALSLFLQRPFPSSSTFQPSLIRPLSASTSSTSSSPSSSSQPFPPPPPPPDQGGRARVRTVFWLLVGTGLITTSYGLYTYFESFRLWPPEIRTDLRAALKAHRRGDERRAEAMYSQAFLTARTIDRVKLGSDPLLKISGIGIVLGSFYEEQGRWLEAYRAYAVSLDVIRKEAQSPKERMRAVSIAQKLGDLARIPELVNAMTIQDRQLGIPIEGDSIKFESHSLAETHLKWSVEELLRLAIPEETRQRVIGQEQGREEEEGGIMLSELNLPPWVTSTSLGASLEALGQLYASQGKSHYAVPLYLQALDLLMPMNKSKRKQGPTASERCRAGILMNNVAQLFVDGKGGDVDQALAWAMRGLDVVAFTQRAAGWDEKGGQGFKHVEGAEDKGRVEQVRRECASAEVALLWNLGELSRMKKDDCKAREFLQRAYRKADQYGMREARNRAAQGLSQLERRSSSPLRNE